MQKTKFYALCSAFASWPTSTAFPHHVCTWLMRRFLHTDLTASAKPLLHHVKLYTNIHKLTSCVCPGARGPGPRRLKDVPCRRLDEKAGATDMVTPTAAGELLGFQMIADGGSHQALNNSCPGAVTTKSRLAGCTRQTATGPSPSTVSSGLRGQMMMEKVSACSAPSLHNTAMESTCCALVAMVAAGVCYRRCVCGSWLLCGATMLLNSRP